MSLYSLREMSLAETKLMIDYFVNASVEFLDGMGVDPTKLPSEESWTEVLRKDDALPLQQKQFYYLVWELDHLPIGHCNVNKIVFGESAYMHLHIWHPAHRRSGCATQLLIPSIRHFFDRLELKRLYCEPYAKNLAPNRSLPKVGFKLEKSYETTPGWIAFHQPVNRWVLERDAARSSSVRCKDDLQGT